MAKYRKIDTRIWNDEKFMSLDCDAKLLYFFLLTNVNLTPLGAMKFSLQGAAEELGKPFERLSAAFAELCGKGLVSYSVSMLLVLKNFLKYNKPESPNVVKSWGKYLDFLPECDLKSELIQIVKGYIEDLPKAFQVALGEGFQKSMPNQRTKNKEQRTKSKDMSKSDFCTAALRKDDRQEIFEHWQKTLNHSKSKLDRKRTRDITKGLALGFTVEELKKAINGCSKNKFNMGENKQGKIYDSLDLIFRDAQHIENFIADDANPNVVPFLSRLENVQLD